MPRLAQSQSLPHDAQPAPIEWQVRGELRTVHAGEPQVWLHLQAHTLAWLACQRCLQPGKHRVEADRWIRFVRDEAQAEVLDAELEEDVLAMPHRLDLAGLLEDELLLSLPLVPRHASCPHPLPMSAGDDDAPDAAAAHPFAALRLLKPGQGNGPDKA
jgi:uncharacterized protein